MEGTDWRTCDHEWAKKWTLQTEFIGTGNTSYQYQCRKCRIYSYAGILYDKLPDKSKSVFLYGNYVMTSAKTVALMQEAEAKKTIKRFKKKHKCKVKGK
jgi:hypothetical protein